MENSSERDPIEDLSIDGIIILMYLKKREMRV
jgi:hypothetical protein